MGVSFDEFWDAYPRKVGKLDAEKAYTKALTRATIHQILEACKRHANNCRGKDAQYIPHPATWLNQGRWDDVAPAFGWQLPPAPQFPPERRSPPARKHEPIPPGQDYKTLTHNGRIRVIGAFEPGGYLYRGGRGKARP